MLDPIQISGLANRSPGKLPMRTNQLFNSPEGKRRCLDENGLSYSTQGEESPILTQSVISLSSPNVPTTANSKKMVSYRELENTIERVQSLLPSSSLSQLSPSSSSSSSSSSQQPQQQYQPSSQPPPNALIPSTAHPTPSILRNLSGSTTPLLSIASPPSPSPIPLSPPIATQPTIPITNEILIDHTQPFHVQTITANGTVINQFFHTEEKKERRLSRRPNRPEKKSTQEDDNYYDSDDEYDYDGQYDNDNDHYYSYSQEDGDYQNYHNYYYGGQDNRQSPYSTQNKNNYNKNWYDN